MALTLPGSPYVESSDLVANYPAVSESLAERVDLVGVLPFASAAARTTAIPTPTDGQYSYLQDTNATEYYNGTAWVAAGVAPGLVHINTTTFSAVSSVSLNSIFTSTYENYLIVGGLAGSNNSDLYLRIRGSGSDITSGYVGTVLYGVGVSAGAAASNTTYIQTQLTSTNFAPFSVTVCRPAIAAPTGFALYSGTNVGALNVGGTQTNSTSYDGITFYRNSGTITGTVRVYGYKNS